MGQSMSELLVELEIAEAKRTVNRVREMLEAKPDLTGAEVLARLEKAYEATRVEAERSRGENAPQRSTRRHCGYPIQTLGWDSGAWRHTDGLSAGCRAASFDRLGTWDDALNRSWKASPTTESG